MASGPKVRFKSGFIDGKWGIADTAGFRFTEFHRYVPSAFPFSVCRIDGRQVAVFIEVEVPAEVRPDLALRKPDWLDAIVYARVLSDPYAEVAVIEAHAQNSGNAGLQMCAFATACTAFDLGLFKVEPRSYLVRLDARTAVRVSIQFDDDTESWFGESTVDFDDTR